MAKALGLLPRMNRREQLRTEGVNAVMLLHDYRHAADVFETLLKEYPGDPTAQNNLAIAKFMLLDFQGAQASGAELVKALPNKHIYRSNFALYAMYSGDLETAVREANRAMEIGPKSGMPNLPLAVAAAYRGNVAEARQWYEQMRTGDSRARQLAVEYIADLLTYTGDAAAARPLLQSQIETDIGAGKSASAARKQLMLAEIAMLDDDAPTAAAAATSAVSLTHTPQVVFRAAMILLDAGQVPAATRVLNQLPQQLQGPDLWYRAIAETELSARHGDRAAIGRFESTLATSRGTWLAHYRAGLLRLRAGEAEAASKHLHWCLEHRPEAAAAYLDDVATIRYWSDAWHWAGVADEAAGDSGAAKVSFENFLAPRTTAQDARTTLVRRRLQGLGR